MKKSIVAILMIFVLIMSFQLVFAKEFTDVPSTHWAFSYVDDLSNKGIINGYNDGSFNPTKKITTAEYIKLLVGTIISESDEKEITKNLSSTTNWYDGYVTYAKDAKLLIKDYEDSELKGEVTREEMAKMLVPFVEVLKNSRVDVNGELDEESLKKAYGVGDKEKVSVLDSLDNLKLEKIETVIDDNYNFGSEEESIEANGTFNDISSLSNDAKKAIVSLSNDKLIAGYEDGSFKPHNTMNRAEVATIIYRLVNFYNK